MFIPRNLLIFLTTFAILLWLIADSLGFTASTTILLFIIVFTASLLFLWLTGTRKQLATATSQAPTVVRRNVDEMIRELENLRHSHRQILLDLPLGVCSIDDSDVINMWNRKLEQVTGLSIEFVSGKKVTELPKPWVSLFSNFLESEYAHIYKQSFELGGIKHTVNLHKSVIENFIDYEMRQGGSLILVEDITETEILEAGLTHSERLASIGRLAAGVAHEIGNPITGIACLAQNIRDEYEDEELRNMTEQIIEQTNRTSRIVQSLVNFAHAGNTQSDSDSAAICVRDCIDEAITLVSLDKRGKNIGFEIECDPQILIAGDSQRLLQVLLNLINNSRDASQPQSTIHLQCELVDETVKIIVEDEGIGIAPAIKDRVFDPFFTTKEAGDGTGLGLSLVFSIVEDLNGNIDIISPTKARPNSGTRVVMRFPRFQESLTSDQTS